MAIAPVLKTGARKGLGVRIPRPPFDYRLDAIRRISVCTPDDPIAQCCPTRPVPQLSMKTFPLLSVRRVRARYVTIAG